MNPFAVASDVADIWRPLTPAEELVVTAWIDQASSQIRDEVPDVDGLDVDDRIAAGTLSRVTVQNVVARMVRRVMVNPNSAHAWSQTIDGYSESVTMDTLLAPGELFISFRELRRLMGIRSGQRSAFGITTAPDNALLVYPAPNPFPVWSGTW